MLPETGASTICAPSSATRAASDRLASGVTVLISTYSFPGERPARIPSGPSVTAESAATFVTMLKTISARSATSRGDSASTSPASTSGAAFSRVRL